MIRLSGYCAEEKVPVKKENNQDSDSSDDQETGTKKKENKKKKKTVKKDENTSEQKVSPWVMWSIKSSSYYTFFLELAFIHK